jgi:hypothetical protein
MLAVDVRYYDDSSRWRGDVAGELLATGGPPLGNTAQSRPARATPYGPVPRVGL